MKNSLFLTPAIYEEVDSKLNKANCSNCSGLVDELRQVKSPLEIEYTRKAAETADVGALAAIEAGYKDLPSMVNQADKLIPELSGET